MEAAVKKCRVQCILCDAMLVADKTTKLQTNNPHVSDDGHNPVTIFQSNLFILLLSVFTVCSPVPSWITVFAMDQFNIEPPLNLHTPGTCNLLLMGKSRSSYHHTKLLPMLSICKSRDYDSKVSFSNQ